MSETISYISLQYIVCHNDALIIDDNLRYLWEATYKLNKRLP